MIVYSQRKKCAVINSYIFFFAIYFVSISNSICVLNATKISISTKSNVKKKFGKGGKKEEEQTAKDNPANVTLNQSVATSTPITSTVFVRTKGNYYPIIALKHINSNFYLCLK